MKENDDYVNKLMILEKSDPYLKASDKCVIDDILYCINKFDDKPHLLFNALRRLAVKYEKNIWDKRVAVELMDAAYLSPHTAGYTRVLKRNKNQKTFHTQRCAQCGKWIDAMFRDNKCKCKRMKNKKFNTEKFFVDLKKKSMSELWKEDKSKIRRKYRKN
jgi:hypothetical protein